MRALNVSARRSGRLLGASFWWRSHQKQHRVPIRRSVSNCWRVSAHPRVNRKTTESQWQGPRRVGRWCRFGPGMVIGKDHSDVACVDSVQSALARVNRIAASVIWLNATTCRSYYQARNHPLCCDEYIELVTHKSIAHVQSALKHAKLSAKRHCK